MFFLAPEPPAGATIQDWEKWKKTVIEGDPDMKDPMTAWAIERADKFIQMIKSEKNDFAMAA